ncbi:hypothetical protein K1T71_011127 [Dendrolimus kikuchii]|uniref:Uncharacterized protein n=1 Tax=Dendrolimus kikuchii TaxID=765133 RepID=A0ACC1CMY8_9NEOP|nr:hypothetical protein K1T71_011127 [Dendrolimus kikuchii]
MLVDDNKNICRICECYWRPHDNKNIVYCNEANINFMPKVDRMDELYVANNNIDIIEEKDLPDTLKFLDLQYNNLKSFDQATLSRLFLGNRTLKLSDRVDYSNLTCVDGTFVNTLDISALCLNQTLITVIISMLCIVILLSTGAYAVWTKFKWEIKAFFYMRGFRCCMKNNDEPTKEYDVFISFAHEDEIFVMEELLPKLEAESLAVCVHYRDWCAGDWIPAQIAKSVAESNMTLIVLSRNFLKSTWALLEFRTAYVQSMHDGRTRLAVLMLEDVLNDVRLDRELKAYLATTTYVRWNEPLYWEKLMYVLPQPTDTRARDNHALGHEVVKLMRPNDPCIRALQERPVTVETIEVAE